MPIKKLTDCEPKELRDYCTVILGIEGILPSHNRSQLIAKIQAVNPDLTEIEVPDAPPPPVVAPPQATSAGHGGTPAEQPLKITPQFIGAPHAYQNDPKIEINIPSTKELGGDRDVGVSVNNILFQIKRDVWVAVPYRVFCALGDARETTYEPTPDEIGRISAIERTNYAYPFNYRNPPSDEAIADWRARTDAVEGA